MLSLIRIALVTVSLHNSAIVTKKIRCVCLNRKTKQILGSGVGELFIAKGVGGME